MSNWWNRRRRLRVDDTSKLLLGPDVLKPAGADDLAAQQYQVGIAIRGWYDAGYNHIGLIQNLLVGACFVADNTGVSREQLAKLIVMVEMKKERQLIYKPDDEG